MDADARRLRFGLPLLVGLFAIAAAFAGSASISERSVAASAAPGDANVLASAAGDAAVAQANAARPAAKSAPRGTLPGGGGVRKNVHCAGCGVVESVRRIDQQEIAGEVCSLTDLDRLWITGHVHDGGKYGGVATLADTVEGVLEGRPGATRMRVTSRYQIVVRFRDGSRHVFNEATGRALQSGERVLVIAGVNVPIE